MIFSNFCQIHRKNNSIFVIFQQILPLSGCTIKSESFVFSSSNEVVLKTLNSCFQTSISTDHTKNFWLYFLTLLAKYIHWKPKFKYWITFSELIISVLKSQKRVWYSLTFIPFKKFEVPNLILTFSEMLKFRFRRKNLIFKLLINYNEK